MKKFYRFCNGRLVDLYAVVEYRQYPATVELVMVHGGVVQLECAELVSNDFMQELQYWYERQPMTTNEAELTKLQDSYHERLNAEFISSRERFKRALEGVEL